MWLNCPRCVAPRCELPVKDVAHLANNDGSSANIDACIASSRYKKRTYINLCDFTWNPIPMPAAKDMRQTLSNTTMCAEGNSRKSINASFG